MGFKQNISVTLDIGANISQVRAAANEMQSILSKINLDKGASSNLTSMFGNLNKALSDLEVISGKSMHSLGDTKKAETAIGKVQSIINSLNQEFSRMGVGGSQAWIKLTDGLVSKLSAAEQAQRKYTQSVTETNAQQKKLENSRDSAAKKATSTSASLIRTQTNYNKALDEARQKTEKLREEEQKRENLVKESEQAKSRLSAKKGQITKFIKANGLEGKIKDDNTFDKRFNISPDIQQKYAELVKQLQELEAQYNKTSTEIEKANDRVDKATTANNAAGGKVSALEVQLKGAEEEAQKAAQKLDEVNSALLKFNASTKNAAAFDELKNELAKTFGDETIKSIDNIEDLNAKIDQLSASASGQVKSGIEAMAGALRSSSPAMKEAGDKAHEVGNSIQEMTSKGKDLDMLSSRFKYFFGIMGGFQLFKRAIRGAVDTIKELDAAMTQTAVVSTKTVDQMWKTLPEYSKKAKELAASMKDVYSAQTLYVQQGLSMDAALNLGVETLKMARVAGIDAATATDSMTAALRGFKMELNEVSAQRINDVYSKLAQNTASNVQEISTAMSKVASLASSANMSFENTAAYLSKIIETTREGAETAGTALKTVIARFSEVKKLYSEGELTGTTEEGEEVDVNKISKALREVGINMNEYFTGAVGLDTIFGELGKKWSSLTTVQQRYIATMAAGSRQQSRFIALMQDWSRTSDLMSMAYDAEGSGQEQFEKTLDSLDAKITKLKTEWQQFVMGIANNEIVKWAVDTGTTILSTINEIIDKLSGGDGLAKAVLSVVGAFAAFKGIGAIVKGVFGNIGVALGTKAAGSVGIGAGLMGMKQKISTLPSLMPTIGRFNDQTGKWTGINKKGRLARVNAANLAQAHDAGVAEARAAQEAYNTESAKLAKLKNPATLQARLQAANADGTEMGKVQAAAVTDKYNQEVKDQERKVGEAQTRLDTAQKNVAGTAPQQTAQLQAYGSALQGIGMAAGIAAGALALLANKLDDGTEKGERRAKVIRGISKGLTALTISLTLVGTAAQIMGAMVAAGAKVASAAIKAIPILGWAAAIGSAIYSIISVIKNLSKEKPPEEVWKEFEEDCEKAAEEAKKVQDAYKDALNQIKDINTKEAKLDELRYGTEEWNTAVQELNDSILKLIQAYPALADAVEYVNDHLVLNTQSEAYKEWFEQQKRTARYSGIVSISASQGKDFKRAEENIYSTFKSSPSGLKERSASTLNPSGYSWSGKLDESYVYKNGKVNFNFVIKQPTKQEQAQVYGYHTGVGEKKYYAAATSTSNVYQKEAQSVRVDQSFDKFLLAELMGGELPFLTYDDKSVNKGVPLFYDQGKGEDTALNSVQYKELEYLKELGLDKESLKQFYRDVSQPLEDAINSGQITSLSTAHTWLKDWVKDKDQYANIPEYFRNLWTKDDVWDEGIPLAKLLQGLGNSTETRAALTGATKGLRLEELEKLGIDKDYWQSYLAFGDKNFLNEYDKITQKEIEQNRKAQQPDTDKTYWANYVYARGLEKETGIFDDQEVMNQYIDQFDLYLRSVLAIERTYGKDNPVFKEFDARFKDLEKSTGGAANLIASGDIKSLTIEQIENIRSFDKNDKDFFEKYFGIDTDKIVDQYDNLFNGLGVNIKNQIKDIATTWGETQSLISGYNRAQATGIEGAGKTFLENMGRIYDLINNIADSDKLKDARDILTSIDWTNTDSINKAIRELDKLGITVDSVLVKELAKATGAVSNFNAKSLEEKVEQLETARSAGDKIKEGKTSVTGKEYKALLETAFSEYNQEGRNWSADWVQIGLDEWVYIGNETNALLSSIDNSVAALLQNTIAEKQQQVTQGKKVKGLLTGEEIEEKEEQVDQGKETRGRLNGKSSPNILIDSGGATGFNTLSMPMRLNIGTTRAILGANIEGTGLGGSVDDNNKDVQEPPVLSPKEITFKYKDKENGNEFKDVTGAEDFARMIMAEGATASDFESTSLRNLGEILQLKPDQLEQEPEQLFETLRLALEDWYNLSTNETILGQSKELLSAMMAQNSSNQQLLGQANTYNGDEQIEQERTTAAGILQGRIQSEEIEGTYDVMKEQGQQWAEEHGQVLSIDNNKESIQQMENGFKALALTSNEAVKNIDNLNSALGDNWDAFKKATKGTPAYTAALNKLLPALKKVFGDKVDSKWIKEHAGLLDKWAKGGEEAEEAIKEFAKEASKGLNLDAVEVHTVNSLGEISDATIDLNDHIAELDGSQLEVGATANFGDLNKQLALTEKEALQTAAALNTIPGTSVTWVKTGTVTMPDGSTRETGYFQIAREGAAGSTPSKSGGGGGGGKKEFKNDFDKYYNMVEDINELIRLRNLLETDYNQLLESENISGKAIYDNLKKQVGLLKERQKLTADLAEKRKGQIFDLLNDEEYKDVKQYAWWNEEDQTIEIDWNAINDIKDSETGDKVKELVQKLEDFQSKYDEQIEALEDIEDALEDIRKRGRDEYISLEERLRDALIAKIQEQIDELSATNEAINTANSNLMDSIQKTLDKQRQERENEKTEKELTDKEWRLAYLRQDSSGANAVEIAQLQKELDEARENYTDQLIDQKISELQEQNDEAAQQRQEQIDLMQQSLDWQEKSGAFWDQVSSLMAEGVDEQGHLVHGSELETLLKSSESWQGLSDVSKMKWLEGLGKMVAQATGYLSLSRQLEDVGTKAGEKITFTNAEGKTLTGVVDKNGNVVVTDKNGNKITYKDVYQDYFDKYHTLESEKDAKIEKKPTTGTGKPSTGGSDGTDGSKTGWKVVDKGTEWRAEYTGKGKLTQSQAESEVSKRNDNRKWGVVFTGSQWIAQLNTSGTLDFKEATKKADKLNRDYVIPYATGGLNTKTGPAWLDGTKSHPELVLNARDTENFIQLKDHLATLRQMSTNGLFGTGGDNYYDIKVQVDSLGNDYDVDMAIDRIKARIYQDGAYRNVNTLNRLR